MTPLFADGIDIPLVLGAGVTVLVPLIAFEIFAEAFVLRLIWRQNFSDLCRFTFFANLWSLVAGIPTKILNVFMYRILLPNDLPGFFARYAMAVGVGTAIYFLITIGVEGLYAFYWLRKNQKTISRNTIWNGILIANLATYAALGPLHYYATRPTHQVRTFVRNTQWTQHPDTKVLFINEKGWLKSIQSDGSNPRILVPAMVRDYLVSTNLNVCLFRGADNNLHFYHHDLGQSKLVWQTRERFFMEQVAFSPSGQHIGMAAAEGNYLEVLEVGTGKRFHQVLLPKFRSYNGPSLAWSGEEMTFYLSGFESNFPVVVVIQPDMTLKIDPLNRTNNLDILPCYGPVGDGAWYGSGDDFRPQASSTSVFGLSGSGTAIWPDGAGLA